jgi:hypothetical protein
MESPIDPLVSSLNKYEQKFTLLFTGHHSRAAIASLLRAHTRSTAIASLAAVAAQFINIHSRIFGAPPVCIAPF